MTTTRCGEPCVSNSSRARSRAWSFTFCLSVMVSPPFVCRVGGDRPNSTAYPMVDGVPRSLVCVGVGAGKSSAFILVTGRWIITFKHVWSSVKVQLFVPQCATEVRPRQGRRRIWRRVERRIGSAGAGCAVQQCQSSPGGPPLDTPPLLPLPRY